MTHGRIMPLDTGACLLIAALLAFAFGCDPEPPAVVPEPAAGAPPPAAALAPAAGRPLAAEPEHPP